MLQTLYLNRTANAAAAEHAHMIIIADKNITQLAHHLLQRHVHGHDNRYAIIGITSRIIIPFAQNTLYTLYCSDLETETPFLPIGYFLVPRTFFSGPQHTKKQIRITLLADHPISQCNIIYGWIVWPFTLEHYRYSNGASLDS